MTARTTHQVFTIDSEGAAKIEKDYEEIEDPAYRTFFREFEIRQNARVVDVVLASFSKPDEFTKYIRTLFAMARLLGEATLARSELPRYVVGDTRSLFDDS